MSSLRLALKQSLLEERGRRVGSSSSSTAAARHRSTNNHHNNSRLPKKRGRPRKYPLETDGETSDRVRSVEEDATRTAATTTTTPMENDEDDEEENELDEVAAADDEEEDVVGDDEEVEDYEEEDETGQGEINAETRTRASHTIARENSDEGNSHNYHQLHQHQRRHHQQVGHHVAANKIQSQWKKQKKHQKKKDNHSQQPEAAAAVATDAKAPFKVDGHSAVAGNSAKPNVSPKQTSSTTSHFEADGDKPVAAARTTSALESSDGEPVHPSDTTATEHAKRKEKTNRTITPSSQQSEPPTAAAAAAASAGKSPIKMKSKFVPAPELETLQWMRQLSVKRARRSVGVGLRVKVRFATKVKREGKVVQKRKWYGGRVSAVSKEGSKIRIKYDDGTSEVTKFPDNDIVVDDTNNGHHQANAEKFIPPPGSNSTTNHDDVTGLESEEVLGKSELESQARTKERAPADDSQPDAVEMVPLKEEATRNNQAEHSHPTETIHAQPEVSNSKPLAVEQGIAGTKKERRTNSPMANEVVDEQQQSHVGRKTETGLDVAPRSHQPVTSTISDTPVSPKPEKKKRGRPRKHGLPPPATSNDVVKLTPTPKEKPIVDTYMDAAANGREELQKLPKDEAVSTDVGGTNSQPGLSSDRAGMADGSDAKAQPGASKPTLTIRISSLNTKAGQQNGEANDRAKQISLAVSDGNVPIKTLGRQQKVAPEASSEGEKGDDEPPLKRLHIHIPAPKKGNPSTGPVNVAGGHVSPKRTTSSSVSDVLSSPMPAEDSTNGHVGPAQNHRLKKHKRKRAEMAAAEAASACSVSQTQNDGSQEAGGSCASEVANDSRKERSAAHSSTQEDRPPMGTIGSRNSAFERNGSTSPTDNSLSDGKPVTPTGRSGNNNSDSQNNVPVVRSGRRAAQQANERIASRQDMVVEDSIGKKKRKRHRRELGGDEDNASESSDEVSHLFQWVQCDGCKKWRIIPSEVVSSLPKQWFCSNNIYDPKRASCDAPEQTPKQVAKEKRKLKRRQQRMLECANAAAQNSGTGTTQSSHEAAAAVKEPVRVETQKESKTQDNVRSQREDGEEFVKDGKQRSSPAAATESDSAGDDSNTKSHHEKKSGATKKSKVHDSSSSDAAASAVVEPSVERRGRGRPRRVHTQNADAGCGPCTKQKGGFSKGGFSKGGFSKGGFSKGEVNVPSPDELAENLEWVQCEKCDKWRKLPPHISADDLPDIWYCAMNTWNPKTANCEAPEDKADGLQDVGVFGGSGSTKLSYRTLIFGNTGRKANRPVSERTRAAESIFAVPSDDDDTPPSVMYANSSAFVSRAKHNSNTNNSNNQGTDENKSVSFFELMSNSLMWSELRAATHLYGKDVESAPVDKQRRLPLFAYTYDNLPDDLQQPVKDLVLHLIGLRTLSPETIAAEAKSGNLPDDVSHLEKARPFCTVNVVRTTLCELVKDGFVDCVAQQMEMDAWNPHYRLSRVYREGLLARQESRCMKLAKPWKKQRVRIEPTVVDSEMQNLG